VLRKVLPQCLAARKQTEMRVGKREHWQESKGRPAIRAAAAMNPNPGMMFVVRLLAAPSVTNDRIPFTDRTSA
jgi:predicted dienelactone hydrolase